MSTENTKRYNRIHYVLVLLLVGAGLLMASSCNQQAQGFALPQGDIVKGKVTYKQLNCTSCHSISGIAWTGGPDSLNIPLGGKVVTKKTYGNLVTSVINPSHKIAASYSTNPDAVKGLSPMKNYNEVMTVQELIDLVTFLQSEYEIELPSTEYRPYYY